MQKYKWTHIEIILEFIKKLSYKPITDKLNTYHGRMYWRDHTSGYVLNNS